MIPFRKRSNPREKSVPGTLVWGMVSATAGDPAPMERSVLAISIGRERLTSETRPLRAKVTRGEHGWRADFDEPRRYRSFVESRSEFLSPRQDPLCRLVVAVVAPRHCLCSRLSDGTKSVPNTVKYTRIFGY